jgi:hypothetical protein
VPDVTLPLEIMQKEVFTLIGQLSKTKKKQNIVADNTSVDDSQVD